MMFIVLFYIKLLLFSYNSSWIQKYPHKDSRQIQQHPHGEHVVFFFYFHFSLVFPHNVFHAAKAQAMQFFLFFGSKEPGPFLDEGPVIAVFYVDFQDAFFFFNGDRQLLLCLLYTSDAADE